MAAAVSLGAAFAADAQVDIGKGTIAEVTAEFNTAIGAGAAVTVSGTRADAEEALVLNIPAGKTVNWNATITGTDKAKTAWQLIDVAGTGTLNITGGKIEAKGVNGTAIRVNSGATLNISGADAVITSVNTNTHQGTVWLTHVTANLNVTNGTVQNTGNAGGPRAIFISGARRTGTVNISGGTVTATAKGNAIRSGGGTLNITGGTFSTNSSDESVIYVGSGTTNISGGTFTSSSQGATIQVGSSSAKLNISGGSITNKKNDAAFCAIRAEYASTTTITGGTIKTTHANAPDVRCGSSATLHIGPNAPDLRLHTGANQLTAAEKGFTYTANKVAAATYSMIWTKEEAFKP
jgi:hypothetical protein